MLTPIELVSRTISFRPDLQAMVVRWHTEAPAETVKAEYAIMLQAAVEHGYCAWLLDVRRREKVPADLSEWVNLAFYPRAVAALAPRRLRLAVLSSPFINEAYRTDPVQQKQVAYALDPARPFDLGLFDNEGQAMSWLQQQR